MTFEENFTLKVYSMFKLLLYLQKITQPFIKKEVTGPQTMLNARCISMVNEPQCEKTGLTDFLPNLTQTSLQCLRRAIKA